MPLPTPHPPGPGLNAVDLTPPIPPPQVSVPSLLRHLLPDLRAAKPSLGRLRLLVSSGEPLDAELAGQLVGVLPPEARLVNLYGECRLEALRDSVATRGLLSPDLTSLTSQAILVHTSPCAAAPTYSCAWKEIPY